MHLVGIPGPEVEGVWPLIARRIAQATARSNGRFTESTIKAECVSGTQQLWVAWSADHRAIRAVMVTQILTFPTGLRAVDVVIVTGEGRRDWVPLLADLEVWARAQDCALVQINARRGWARELSSYRLSHIFLERRIDE